MSVFASFISKIYSPDHLKFLPSVFMPSSDTCFSFKKSSSFSSRSVPLIDKLIITRTKLKRAEELASVLREDADCSVNDIIAEKISNTSELIELLEEYNPEFIGITARERDMGDTIHAVYSLHALNYGAVLCEKPFANASGDGSSLKYLTDLFNYEKSDLFGLELPFAVVMKDIMQKKDLSDLFIRRPIRC